MANGNVSCLSASLSLSWLLKAGRWRTFSWYSIVMARLSAGSGYRGWLLAWLA